MRWLFQLSAMTVAIGGEERAPSRPAPRLHAVRLPSAHRATTGNSEAIRGKAEAQKGQVAA